MKGETFIIVSDIHSNIYALRKFLEYIERYDFRYILNCGDFLQKGPNPTEVYDIVMNDERFINILGNNDLELIDRGLRRFSEVDILHQNWVIDRLGEERMARLKEVPLKRDITINNKKILMVHSRMNSTTQLPLIYQGKTLEEYVMDYEEECDYVIIGHSHYPSIVSHWMGKTILNPGSIGCSKDSTISFIIANIDEDEIGFEFKKIKYDNSHAVREILSLKIPDGERIINSFYGS